MKKLILSITKLILLSATLIASVFALVGCKQNDITSIEQTAPQCTSVCDESQTEDQAILDEDQISKAIYGASGPVMNVVLIQFVNNESEKVTVEISLKSEDPNIYFIKFIGEDNSAFGYYLTSYEISTNETDYIIEARFDKQFGKRHIDYYYRWTVSLEEYTKLETEAFRRK